MRQHVSCDPQSMGPAMEDISQGLESEPIPCQPSGDSSYTPLLPSFRYVRRNIPGLGADRRLFEGQLRGCQCQTQCQPHSCLCLPSHSHNYHTHPHTTPRLLPHIASSPSLTPIFECNSRCSCNASCPNRLVQHGPRARLRVAPAGRRGWGLFACQDVPQLNFVCEYAGEVVSPSEARRRVESRGDGEESMNYLIVLREHCRTGVVLTCVDPQLAGNVGRFANHSCDPNLLMVPVRVDSSVPRLALFARRDISAGEELTFDYSGQSLLGDASQSNASAQGNSSSHDNDSLHSNTITMSNSSTSCQGNALLHSIIPSHNPITSPEAVQQKRVGERCCDGEVSSEHQTESDLLTPCVTVTDNGDSEENTRDMSSEQNTCNCCMRIVSVSKKEDSSSPSHCERCMNCDSLCCHGEKASLSIHQAKSKTKDVVSQRRRKETEDISSSRDESNNHKQSKAEATDIDATNQRKRKHSEDKTTSSDHEESLKSLQAEASDDGSYQTLQTDCVAGSPTGKAPVLKVCHCGAAQCRGYLPFDRHIFQSS